MAKKQQSTQQPSEKVGGHEDQRSWDTPSLPITPTPAPTQPTPTPTQPAPTQPTPAPNPQPSTEKE